MNTSSDNTSKDFSTSEVIKDYTERDYRTVWQKPRSKFENHFEGIIIRQMLSKKSGWFLDLGAGYGRLYPEYAMEGRNIVMADYAMNLLQMAATEHGAKPNVYFVAADAYHLPFKNEVFSAGITIRTFHHMNIPQRFMEEMSRTLNHGAEMLFEYSNKRNIARILKKGSRALKKDHEEYAEWQFGTHPDYLDDLAASKGLTVKRTLGTAFFPRFITEKTLAYTGVLGFFETIFDFVFGRMSLAPMNFAELVKTTPASTTAAPTSLIDLLQCPSCQGTIAETPEGVRCASCQRTYQKVGQVWDFRIS